MKGKDAQRVIVSVAFIIKFINIIIILRSFSTYIIYEIDCRFFPFWTLKMMGPAFFLLYFEDFSPPMLHKWLFSYMALVAGGMKTSEIFRSKCTLFILQEYLNGF